MSFLDTLKNLGLWQGQGQGQPQPNPYGLDQPAMRQAGLAALGNIGGQIMALSQQMTPDQRARMMAGADWTGGLQSNLYNAAQMKLMGDAQRRKQMESERDQQAQAYALQQLQAMPDSPQKRKALIYAQLGDYAKAIETAMPQAQQPEYQIVDGYYINKNNPNAPAIPVQGLPEAAPDAPNPGDIRAAAGDYYKSPEYTTFTSLNASLGSLRQSIDTPDKVADLDFVYAAANALDPGSVVREGDYLQIVRTQGLPGELLSNINQVVGGQGLTRETREKLYRLIQGRANQWRDATMRRRDAVLRYSPGILQPDMLDVPTLIPGLPPPPAPRTEPGRVDLPPIPEPPLVRVEE